MRHDIDAGAVAHGRGVQNGVARRRRIHLSGIGEARLRQHLMAEHGAFRPSGGSRGVEQPGEIVGSARHKVDRIGRKQCRVFGAADRDQSFERCGRVRGDLAVDAGGGKADARARLLQDVAELGTVQLGIGRHRGKTRVPDAVEQRDIVGRIFGRDDDAVAGLKSAFIAQRARQPRRARGQFAVGRNHTRAQSRRGPIRVTETGAIKPQREVHASPSSFRGRRNAPDPEARCKCNVASGFRVRVLRTRRE